MRLDLPRNTLWSVRNPQVCRKVFCQASQCWSRLEVLIHTSSVKLFHSRVRCWCQTNIHTMRRLCWLLQTSHIAVVWLQVSITQSAHNIQYRTSVLFAWKRNGVSDKRNTSERSSLSHFCQHRFRCNQPQSRSAYSSTWYIHILREFNIKLNWLAN